MGDCLRDCLEGDSGGDSGRNLAGDVRGLLLCNVQDDSGINSARGLGVRLEFSLPSHPNRRPECHLLSNLESHLRDSPQGNLRDYLPSSVPGCVRMSDPGGVSAAPRCLRAIPARLGLELALQLGRELGHEQPARCAGDDKAPISGRAHAVPIAGKERVGPHLRAVR